MHLSRRVRSIKPAATLALNQKAKTLAQGGKSIVNLTLGEPDLPTPERICKAAKRAIDDQKTKYTATAGILELRQAIATKLNKQYGRNYRPQEILVTNGAKQALFNVCMSTLNPGDEVLVFSPYWVSYTDMVELAEGRPVVIPTEESQGFLPNLERFQKALNPRTKLLILNSPCNPTGTVYPSSLYKEMVDILAAYPELYVMTDDIYEQFVFGDEKFSSIGMSANFPTERLLLVGGASKSYAMTGWRIGFTAGPLELITAMDNVQSQSTSNPSSVSQWAALEAFTGPQTDVESMRNLFEERRNLMFEGLSKIPGLTVNKPKGAFYIFPNIKSFLGRGGMNTDLELVSYLLEKHGLAVVPGSAFGAEGYLRLSYAASNSELKEGLKRLTTGLSELK